MKKILVVNINWLGDAIFSTPVFAALKKAYPSAHVACLCVPRVREVLRYCPHIDEIIVYDEKGKDISLVNKVKLILRLRHQGFDAAFLLHRSMTRALLVFLAGIPLRIGYGKYKALLTNPIKNPGDELHRSDYYLKVLEGYGILCTDRSCQLRLAPADINNVELKLKKQGIPSGERFIVFNTGGNWGPKRWPLSYWAGLARRIDAMGVKIIFSGAVNDAADAVQVIEASGIQAFNFSGQTSLGESLALFRRAAVVVSADSGPLHLANSVGANVVGIFGPTRVEITGPRGPGAKTTLFKDIGCNKAPCYHLSCKDNLCIQAVGVDDVCEALQEFIR